MASSEATIPDRHPRLPEGTRRDFLYIATGTVATVGAAAVFVPLIAQMNPDASTLAAGGPVDLDVGKIEPGQQVVVRWRERPIFVFHRTPQNVADACRIRDCSALLSDPNSSQMQQAPYAANAIVRSSRSSGFWSAFVRISAASRCSIRSQTHNAAHRLAGRLLLPLPRFEIRSRPDGSSLAFLRPTICRCRPIRFVSDSTMRVGENPPGSNFDFASIRQL